MTRLIREPHGLKFERSMATFGSDISIEQKGRVIRSNNREMKDDSMGENGTPIGVCHTSVKPFRNVGKTFSLVVPGIRVSREANINKAEVV